jgi:hypothetical protein
MLKGCTQVSVVGILGDKEILNLRKTAFLCSRQIPASVVLKCYDWAIDQRDRGNCVIGGFHSQIEKDVLHYLLKGQQPVVIALARGMKTKFEPSIAKAIDDGRLLIITPFSEQVRRVSKDTADVRNVMMVNLADTVTVGHSRAGGKLEELLRNLHKPIIWL